MPMAQITGYFRDVWRVLRGHFMRVFIHIHVAGSVSPFFYLSPSIFTNPMNVANVAKLLLLLFVVVVIVVVAPFAN